MIPTQIKIVGKAIIILHDRGEGTVNEIIANNYPRLTTDDIVLAKAFIVSERPEIIVEQ